MIAGIIRSWLRPAHAQPVDDENSSLHVHVDAEGRAKDQIYWEKEKERERRRTARSNTRAQPAAGGSSIELAPRLPIFHGTGSPSTEGPVPSVNELVAPVLDRRAERFPAHGGVGVPTAHLHSIPVAPSPPVIVPPSQPRSGNIGTTSATFNMAESHDHYVPIPGFSEPSAEECMALAAAEAARKREEEDALSAPAPPLPSQSPVLSEMDYRTMNLSPGPAPSFLEPYYPQQNPPVSTENPEQPAALQIPSQQPLPTTPQSKITHPKRVSPFIATATSVKGGVPPIASSTGVVSSVAGDAKVKKPKSSKKTPEVESITPAGESKHRDKGKDREHHVSGKTSSSKRTRDKERDGERDKDRHKHKSSEDKKESKEKREKKIRKHREKQKESTIQIPPGMAPAHAAGRVSSSMPHKEKENVPPPAKTAVPPPEGILKSTEERKHHSRRSEDHDNGAQREHRHHHHSRHKSSVTDPETGKKKTVKVRTPEEQAAHDQRKEERARVKAAEKAARQAAKINEGAEGANSDKVVSKDDKPHEKHHKGKSSTRGDGERKHRHRRREGETEEERSQRKAAKRARKLAEAVKADAVNATLGTPPSEGNKRHSTNLDLTGRPGRILSPVPEGSTEPADSIRLPLSPAGYPIPKATPIPDLPELPAGDVIRNSSGPFGEPTAYTQAQIPPRPSTPPPAAYSQGIALPPAGAVHIAQLRHRRSYDEKIVVLPEAVQSNHAGSSRHRTSKSKAPLVIPLVPQPVATSSAVPESKEERRRRKSERAQPASQPYPPPAAAIVPPEEAHAARQHRKKRTPEEIEAKRLRKEARKAKVAAANAALQAINEDEALTSASGAYQTKDSGPELTAYQANALRNNSVLGLHQPDPRTQPGYGHYGYGTDGKTIGLTSPPPGKGPKHKKSVTIDTGARDGGPSYARDGREKLREKERERQRKEREKEAKANEAKTKAQNTTGKRFGMFSLKRSFSKLFRV